MNPRLKTELINIKETAAEIAADIAEAAETRAYNIIEKGLDLLDRFDPLEDVPEDLEEEEPDGDFDEPIEDVDDNPALRDIIERVVEYYVEPLYHDEVAALITDAYDFGREVGKWEHVFGRKA